jgi:hypothetical protein
VDHADGDHAGERGGPVGLTPDNDTVTSPVKDWVEVEIEVEIDLTTPREGHTYDPSSPVTWAYCPKCTDELDEIHATFTDGSGDYDIVRCLTCGYEEHI